MRSLLFGPNAILTRLVLVLAGLMVSNVAQAQVSFLPYRLTPIETHAVCHLQGSIVLTSSDDCGTNIDLFEPFAMGIYVGGPDGIQLNSADGSAVFNGSSTFNGGVEFNGAVSFRNTVNFRSIITTGIQNGGSLSTVGINNTGTLLQTGNARFTGAVSMEGFSASTGQIGELTAGTVVTSNLTVAPGGQVDMGGNRVQNVSGPVADTDAANKGYVDSRVSNVQSGVATLTTQVAAQGERLTTVEATTTALGSAITAIRAVDTRQDDAITAASLVNDRQTQQISALQNNVAGLQGDVAGLKANIRQANGGIAAAVALGGTMVVPDSKISMSFNLATYRGEQGFSGAIVGRVAPKMYIQGGVSGSTVKGSVTGRVGVTFGL